MAVFGSLIPDFRKTEINRATFGALTGAAAGVDALLEAQDYLYRHSGATGNREDYNIFPADRESDVYNKIDGYVVKDGLIVAMVQAKSRSEDQSKPLITYQVGEPNPRPGAPLAVSTHEIGQNPKRKITAQAVPIKLSAVQAGQRFLTPQALELDTFLQGCQREALLLKDKLSDDPLLIYQRSNYYNVRGDLNTHTYTAAQFAKDMAEYAQTYRKTPTPA